MDGTGMPSVERWVASLLGESDQTHFSPIAMGAKKTKGKFIWGLPHNACKTTMKPLKSWLKPLNHDYKHSDGFYRSAMIELSPKLNHVYIEINWVNKGCEQEWIWVEDDLKKCEEA